MPASDTALILACKLWDKITDKMHEGAYEIPENVDRFGGQAYSEGDYKPLQCRITGKQAELTVGSSSGHKAKVDLDKGTIEYFDDDDEPNQTMKELFEEDARLRCETPGDGVKCTGVTKKNVDEVFKILAMPTSMDFRLQHCKEETRPDPTEPCEEQCAQDLKDNYNIPDYGCDCSEHESECVQDCVDNWQYDDEDGNCVASEKQLYREGPKTETLTKQEATFIPKSQKSLEVWTT